MAENWQTIGEYTCRFTFAPKGVAETPELGTLKVSVSAVKEPPAGKSMMLKLPQSAVVTRARWPLEGAAGSAWSAMSGDLDDEGTCLYQLFPRRTNSSGEWKLEFALPGLRCGKDKVFRELKVAVFENPTQIVQEVVAEPDAPGSKLQNRVALEANPRSTTALPYGSLVTLTCRVPLAVQDAMLYGSMARGTGKSVEDGETISVWALGNETYTLRGSDGTYEYEDRVQISVQTLQQGLRAFVRPRNVLPGGPVAMFYTGVNTGSVHFQLETSDSEGGQLPSLRNYGVSNPGSNAFQNSFMVYYGPGRGKKWTLRTAYNAQGSPGAQDENSNARKIQAVIEWVIEPEDSDKPSRAIQKTLEAVTISGFAAGYFRATFQDGKFVPPSVKDPGRGVEWGAAATEDGVFVFYYYAVGQRSVMKWFRVYQGYSCLAVTAAQHPSGTQTFELSDSNRLVVAARIGGENYQLISIDLLAFFGASTTTEYEKRHGNIPVIKGPIGLTALGARVYVRGGTVSGRFDLDTTAGMKPEPLLLPVTNLEWQVVGVMREHNIRSNDGKVTETLPAGSLYAFHPGRGILLRFDVDPTASKDISSLLQPRICAEPNGRLAKLDLLNFAQHGSWIPNHGQESIHRLKDAKGCFITEADANGAPAAIPGALYGGRGSWELDPGCVNYKARMVAMAGILAVRCELTDGNYGGVLQDRVYDPRLNVWARCGHLFASGGTELHMAAARTTLDPHSTVTLPAQGSIFSLLKGKVTRISGDLLEMLGCYGQDLEPNPNLPLLSAAQCKVRDLMTTDPMWVPEFKAGERMLPGQFILSPNGRCRVDFTAKGALVISRLADEKTWKPKPPANSSLDISYWEQERTSIWNPTVPSLKEEGDVVFLKLQAEDANFFVVGTKRDRSTYTLWGANDNGLNLGKEAFTNLVTKEILFTIAERFFPFIPISRGEKSITSISSYEEECRESMLWLSDDGNLRLLTKSGVVLWKSATLPPELKGLKSS